MENQEASTENSTSIPWDCVLVKEVPVGVAAMAFLLSFLTVFGNSLVVIAIVKDPFSELRTIPNYHILNLAACDLIVGIPSELLLGLSYFYASYDLYYGTVEFIIESLDLRIEIRKV